MKSILISIKPQYVCDILNGHKTIEIRKSMPKCDLPIKVYIYCTKDKQELCFKKYRKVLGAITDEYKSANGKVVACFTLDKVDRYCENDTLRTSEIEKTCLTSEELWSYANGKYVYFWHISNLKIFDTPLPLQPYFDLDRPPQSWQYLETTIKTGYVL